MKKKIAIIHNLPVGGGLRMLNAIIERYKLNCDIDVISISNKFNYQVDGVTHINIKVSPWKGFILYNFWLIFILPYIHKNVAKKYEWSKYDFVFATHDYFTKSPYLLRYLKNRVIYLCQEPQREYYESWNIHAPYLKDKIANLFRYPVKVIDEINVRFVSKIICNSKYSKEIIQKVYRVKCDVVYPGVDEKLFFPTAAKKEDIILCVGRINMVKGQDFIINSLRPILRKYNLMLIGNGRKEDIQYIEKLTRNNQNINIKNSVSDIELVDYYRKARVTCIAAHNEPFGLSSIESQACGTPVVSVNEGGPRETIINGVTGFLVNRNEKDYLRKTILAIKNCDKIKIKSVKNIVDNWTWNKTLKPLDKYFID